jgi:hypothetical protein
MVRNGIQHFPAPGPLVGARGEVYLQDYCTTGDALKDLGDYFNFYNNERLHQRLGYKPPGSFYAREKRIGGNRKQERAPAAPGPITPRQAYDNNHKKGDTT